jgi:hypothetical protein
LEEELDPLTKKQQQLVSILELIRIESYLPCYDGCEGRPQKSRSAIARSFVAKMVYNMDTTTILIERLKTDKSMRRICGWESIRLLPSEATFSRAFAEFANSKLAAHAHQILIQKTVGDAVVLHDARDSTAIESRERPKPKVKTKKPSVRKKGRPKKGEEKSPLERRIEKQKTMTLEEMLLDLPKECDKGAKKDSKGNLMYWTGYKLHLDTIEGGIPVSAVVTSASVHDSQVAIPLATLTAQRITHCYDLMDAAYDDPAILSHSRSLGHVPLVDVNPRGNKALQKKLEAENLARKTLNFSFPETIRYNARSVAERSNARLKDEFGASKVRVRGTVKVTCHLMLGVLVLTADQLLKLVT